MKKIIAYITVLVMSIFMIPIVNAEEKTVSDANTLKSTITDLNSKGGTIKLDGAESNIELTEFLNINTESSITIDFNGHTLTRTNGGTVILNITKGTVILKDSSTSHNGGISKKNGIAVMVDGAGTNVTIESGNYKVVENNDKYTAIQVNNGATLNVKGTANIDGNYGITVYGNETKVNVSGGTINGVFGISGNGSKTTSSEINISGGKVVGSSAAIYQPQTGSLNISGGTLEGSIGVVARQGNIKVSDKAIINANGKAGEKCSVGDAKTGDDRTKLSCGVGIVVDNSDYNGGYATTANVKIEGGTIKATAENAVESQSSNDTDFEITGGTYNQKFNENFVKNSEAEVQIGSNYYVGTAAKNAVAKASSGTKVTVLQGNLNVSNVGEGVTVENKGTGTVKVNEVEIKKDTNYTTPVTSHSNNDDEKEEKDYTITENVTYADNGEDIEIEGSIVTDATETTEAIKETYDKMVAELKEKGYTEIFNMYEFHVKDNKSLTKLLTLTFDLGEKNNGRVAYILHQKHDGSYEEFENTVENGKVSITVSELSPFVVALKDKEEETVEESTGNNAQTASSDILKYGILSVGALVSFVALVVKIKKEREEI